MPEDYDEVYKKQVLEQLPIPPQQMRYKIIPASAVAYKRIKECLKNFDTAELILSTDAYREGVYQSK